MVLDPPGKVLISHNIETFVCDGSDNGVTFFWIRNKLLTLMYSSSDTSIFKRQIWYLSQS